MAPRRTIPANKLLYQSHATWPRWGAGPVPNIKLTSSGDKGVLRELMWKNYPKIFVYIPTFQVLGRSVAAVAATSAPGA